MTNLNVTVIDQSSLKARGYFYVGGTYKGAPGKRHMGGQMFVEVYVPNVIRAPYPIIMFHGAGQTNLNWLGTPDGRMGWADYFVEQGYVVYLAEQPARGRSAYHPQEDGPRIFHPVEALEQRFTSTRGSWPSASLHTQWPENGRTIGTEIFDQFAASQVEYLPDNGLSQKLVLDCAKDLFKKTGPAILLTHSQAGPFGWNIADAYPDMVKAIVALEPSGPPFSNDLSCNQAKNYGISELPLHFEPPIQTVSDFQLKLHHSGVEGERDGWVLNNQEYRLPRLSQIPILILTAEASYHAQYDHLTSHVLKQLGVEHDFVKLADAGIHGNGHMMMLETNNLTIAAYIRNWLVNKIPDQGGNDK